MSNDTDDRKIEDILFAQDSPDGESRRLDCCAVRDILLERGACIAQDVIDLGCTGLVHARKTGAAVADVAFARSHMAGAGFGIPCYVPPTRFCLVHNTIGGLQPNQKPRHQDGLDLCSRELTPEEQGHAAGVQALINKEGEDKAKRLFGAEKIDPVPAAESAMPATSAAPTIVASVPIVTLGARFVCPEHATIVWACRYCLAAAVIHGPIQPDVYVECVRQDGSGGGESIEKLAVLLAAKDNMEINVFVRAKCWKRQMVETNE
jgi:hypothetical protein